MRTGVAGTNSTAQPQHSPGCTTRHVILISLAALVLRRAVALVSPGTIDSRNFVHTAEIMRMDGSVYDGYGDFPYPPPYAYVLELTAHSELGLKIIPILADSLIALLVGLIAGKWGWAYALNPITILITAHQGQFDPVAYLPVVIALSEDRQPQTILSCGQAVLNASEAGPHLLPWCQRSEVDTSRWC